jgi:pimeloyl-ACP methyl ester carboxylesterase
MARFLLIHGAAHGAWCWHAVIPALDALGHAARAIDLPSHGDDPTPVATVTLDDYARAILDALDRPAILVGHSMAGYAITRAAEIDPTGIERLVFLCAYTPWDGLTLSQMRREAPSQPLLPAIRTDPSGAFFSFDPAMVPDLFYHDCALSDASFALERVCPQARAPSETVVALTDRSQRLPRSYIVCSEDRAIPPAFQRRMAARFAPGDVTELPTSHSPFLSAPEALAARLDAIAQRR